MARIAIVYTTIEGHTNEIVDHLATRVRAAGDEPSVFAADAAPASLADFEGVLVGGSIHIGKQHPDLAHFAQTHRAELEAKPAAFFSVSLTASRADAEHQDQAMAVVQKFIAASGWHPDAVALFGGALLYTRYGFVKRHLLKWIASREHGDTDTSRDFDYTDYEAVEHFADDFLARVHAGAPVLAGSAAAAS
jgi:menaquinone-dependent protoporphyrinogen oxidase